MQIKRAGIITICLLSIGPPLYAQEDLSIQSDESENTVSAATQRAEGNALRWSPTPMYRFDKPYDRCLDSDAIASGMDGGSLEEDRANIGLDCTSNTGPRYAHASALGGIVVSDSTTTPVQVRQEGEIALMVKDDLLGYYGSDFGELKIQGKGGDAYSILPETLNYVDGTTYGLAVNLTGLTATSMTVGYQRSTYKHPISIQPGEVFAFALPDTPERLDQTEVYFTADETESLDLNRSILVTGAPGYWFGRSNAFPALARPLADEMILRGTLSSREETSIFVTNLELVNASTTLKTVPKISNVAVSVAFLDSDNRVIGMTSPTPYEVNSDSDVVLEFRESDTVTSDGWLTIAFEIPADAEDFSIWVGGSK